MLEEKIVTDTELPVTGNTSIVSSKLDVKKPSAYFQLNFLTACIGMGLIAAVVACIVCPDIASRIGIKNLSENAVVLSKAFGALSAASFFSAVCIYTCSKPEVPISKELKSA